MSLLKCPCCGWNYDPDEYASAYAPRELVPHHAHPYPGGSWCPGSDQHPRNPETDRRPLWKDLPSESQS